MYNSNLKVGKTIAVYGCKSGIGVSTTAAMTASLLAAKGDKTLLITLDSEQPFDAVSLLSSDIIDNRLDEMVVLENSSGLTEENFNNYVEFLTDTLGYLRASSRLTHLTKTPAKTINSIVDTACKEYSYIVLDLGFKTAAYADAICEHCDLIIHLIPQTPKGMTVAKQLYTNTSFGKDQFVVPVIADYQEDIESSLKHEIKALKNDIYVVSHSPALFKAVENRNVADYVYKNFRKPPVNVKSFFRKNPVEEITAVDELAKICDLIKTALLAEEQGGE